MRHQIDQILEELWRDDRCRECIRQHATASTAAAAAAGGPNAAAVGPGGVPGGLFAGFVSAVLNDLMYLFKDSLERLADVKQIEDSKADAAVSMRCTFCAAQHRVTPAAAGWLAAGWLAAGWLAAGWGVDRGWHHQLLRACVLRCGCRASWLHVCGVDRLERLM
jgi:hypothetical protein